MKNYLGDLVEVYDSIFKQNPVCVTVVMLRASHRIYFQGFIIQWPIMIVIFFLANWKVCSYYVFHSRVTLFFANNSLMQCRITMKILRNFFLDHEGFFSSHTMFINVPTKKFTLTHLVTFSISRSRIRMKFYFVYRSIRLWTKCLWMNC